MKKFFVYAVAFATTLGLNSCLSEEEVNLEKSNMGTININIEADNSLATRATVGVSDPTSWYAYINGRTTFGLETEHALISGKPTNFLFGAYDIVVSNYANMAAAHEANTGLGAAYYEGTQEHVDVVAGGIANVTINCGRAKNVKFVVEATGFTGDSGNGLVFEEVEITSNSTEAERLPQVTTSNEAYFVAATTLGYTAKWKKDGVAKTYDGTIALAGAGTLNKISLSTNSNGSITIAANTGITYEDTWTDGTTSIVVVSAETGNRLP